jgi:U3 small nucleolar RNA-associated protein 25
MQDQGFTRPKVLVIMPFRQSALDFVEDLMKLAPRSSSDEVANNKRFRKEFSEEEPAAEEAWIRKPGECSTCSATSLLFFFMGFGFATCR